jgi:signal transduction histidine kinase
LALCKVLINAMGGTITFSSTGRAGEGTVFIITLPTPPVEVPIHAMPLASKP